MKDAGANVFLLRFPGARLGGSRGPRGWGGKFMHKQNEDAVREDWAVRSCRTRPWRWTCRTRTCRALRARGLHAQRFFDVEYAVIGDKRRTPPVRSDAPPAALRAGLPGRGGPPPAGRTRRARPGAGSAADRLAAVGVQRLAVLEGQIGAGQEQDAGRDTRWAGRAGRAARPSRSATFSAGKVEGINGVRRPGRGGVRAHALFRGWPESARVRRGSRPLMEA